MKEMAEMMYQYDRDYFFDSSKFNNHFDFKTTSYQEGVKLTVKQTTPKYFYDHGQRFRKRKKNLPQKKP